MEYTEIFKTITKDKIDSIDDYANDFVNQSNLIEGIRTKHIGTIYIDKHETLDDAMHRTFPEYIGHRKALEHVLENASRRMPTIDDILLMHKNIGKYLINDAGMFRKKKIYIKKTEKDKIIFDGKIYYNQVPRLMKELESKIKNKKIDPWQAHNLFEVIHPFSDGNGRTGRLLLNWLTINYENKYVVVDFNKRKEYFKAIEEFEQKFKRMRPDIRFYKTVIIPKYKRL